MAAKCSISGVILLDKPSGPSSAQALARLKHQLAIEKIGHAGTLDPMATGLLVCLLNDATRLAPFAEAGEKIYTGSIKLGLVTDSDDITGNPLRVSAFVPDFGKIESAVQSFRGEIQQTPPAYSAIKVGGQRSYNLARSGQEVELKSRAVQIRQFEVSFLNKNEIGFRIQCSKGTYIRSLARDLGEQLGCGATLASLRREASLPFKVQDAKSLQHVTLKDIILPQALFPNIPSVLVESDEILRLRNGDQRLLKDLAQSIEIVDKTHDKFICLDKATRRIVSLVVREGLSWQYAANFRN